MLAMLRRTAFSSIFFLVASVAMGQVATGTYPYGTFDSPGLDTINVGNLNAHLTIPVLNKAGRGLPFFYNLNYDSSVWAPGLVNGSEVWTPVQNFGWRGVTEITTGFVSFNTTTNILRTMPTDQGSVTCTTTVYSNFVYHDTFGVQHTFPIALIDTSADPASCNPRPSSSSGTATASDGSGYTISVANFTHVTLTSATGRQINPPISTSAGAGTAIDSNGNKISTDGNGNFTDTTGKVVLTVAGSAPNPQIFTYKDATGTSRQATVNYGQYTVQTAFGCSGIGEYAATATSLVNSIQLADGSTYSFSYEATPNGSGNVTGRVASVGLPQGGSIHYTYSGGSNGIECADGSAAGLTRTIPADSGSPASTWTYTRNITETGTSTTAAVDGLGNNKSYTFVEASNQSSGTTAQYYETSRTVYQGAASGTAVLARNTCYNQATSPCNTSAFTLPVSQIDIYETLNGSQTHGATAKYNTFGLQTEADVYDFGSGSRGGLLRQEKWTYGASIVGLVTEDDVFDGSGAPSGKTLYGYDTGTLTTSSGVPQHLAIGNAGNLTSLTQFASAGTSYSSSFTYEDTGSLLTSTTPNGTTTYSYDPTFVYNTGVSLPTPSSGVALSTGAGFDTANTGLPTSSTDPNGQVTRIPSYDPLLRPAEVDYP